MAKQQHQDFWKVGNRFYFTEDGTNRTVDLGVIQSSSPNFEQTVSETYDPDCGVNTVVESSVTQTKESYVLTSINFGRDSLRGLFKGSAYTELTQTAGQVSVNHTVYKDGLLKVVSGTGENVYKLASIDGLYSGNYVQKTITDIVVSTGEVTFLAGFVPDVGQMIIFEDDLAEPLNAGTYEIESVTGQVATLTEESRARLVSDETGIVGKAIAKEDSVVAPGTIFARGTDWDVFEGSKGLNRGLVRIPSSSSIVDGTTYKLVYTKLAITGMRQFEAGVIPSWKGKGFLTFARGGCTDETVREFTNISVSFGNPSFSVEEASTLEITVEVLTKDGSSGRVVDYLGEITGY